MKNQNTPAVFRHTEHFEASPEQVWDLLVNPVKTREYMFGAAIVSDYQVGHPFNWEGPGQDGKVKTWVKGILKIWEPPHKLSYTLFPTGMDLEDKEENYLYIIYNLSSTENGTKMEIEQGDYSKVALGQKRYEDTVKGWGSGLEGMKKLL